MHVFVNFFIFLLLFLNSSCFNIFNVEPIHSRIGGRLQSQYIKQMKKKYNLEVYGVGGGMLYDIEKVAVSFSTDRTFNLEEARAFYIQITDEMIDFFNMSEEARPYLHNYPFNFNNTRINFSFEHRDGSPTAGINHIVHSMYDQIRYSIRDPYTNEWTLVLQESYEEAKAKLAEQKENASVILNEKTPKK